MGGGHGLDWSGPGWGKLAGSCKCSNEQYVVMNRSCKCSNKTSGSKKMRGISSIAENRLCSQEGLCSMKSVSKCVSHFHVHVTQVSKWLRMTGLWHLNHARESVMDEVSYGRRQILLNLLKFILKCDKQFHVRIYPVQSKRARLPLDVSDRSRWVVHFPLIL